jgi:hypothetical protein
VLKYRTALIGSIACTFTALNVLAGLLGTLRPPHPALAGFTACPDESQPCWNGIIPGVTTIEQSRQIMAFAGPGVTLFDDLTEIYTLYYILPQPSPICVVHFVIDRTVVGRIQLQICRDSALKVGDLTNTLGLPQNLVIVAPQNLVYAHVTVNTKGFDTPFRPDSPISFVNVLQPAQIKQQLFAWHGFIPRWRYCQLEPDYPLC